MDINTVGPPSWNYKCRHCGFKFQMPAPCGPSEEKTRTCPECGSSEIEHTDIFVPEACPPGG